MDVINLPNSDANCTHDVSRETPLTDQADCRYSNEYNFPEALYDGEK